MKKLIYLIVVFLSVLLARHITATRAVGFIYECLSKEDQILVRKGLSGDEAEKKVQLEIAQRGIEFVSKKQTAPERFVTRLFGLYLFD